MQIYAAFVLRKRDPKAWTLGTGQSFVVHTLLEMGKDGSKLSGIYYKTCLKKGMVPTIQPVPTPEQLEASKTASQKRRRVCTTTSTTANS